MPWTTCSSDLHGLDLDQYVANHPLTGIGVGGAQFAGTIGSWLLPEPISNCQLTFDGRWYRPGGSTQLLSLGSMNGGIDQCVIREHSSIYRCSECSFRMGFVTGTRLLLRAFVSCGADGVFGMVWSRTLRVYH